MKDILPSIHHSSLRIHHFVEGSVKRMKTNFFVLVVALAFASPSVSARAVSVSAARAERVSPAGEVVVVLNEGFLNSLLEAIASQPEPPSFPLSKGGDANKKCASQVQLLRESAGTRTSVRFIDGRITAPVAFRGSYQAPLPGCITCDGSAAPASDLRF